MTLKDKYPNYNLVHFIEMYDDVITIEMHTLNAIIFENKTYVDNIIKELNMLESKQEEYMIIEFMNQCGWKNEKEKSVQRIRQELKTITNLNL